ncbi:hypothetical protein [Caballeronia telluris]|uniref:Uncharacterized protein n=1 Tax=Caballeronia telluris TaxID=326475 RepID=A0A158F4Q6_9BURK|nr:hypothetical protein [Caballeronia telluris]SAL14731.1 hypothetical protein AWB66_00587 [Caballeronia telluris]
MIEIVMKLGPWILAGLSAAAALLFHWNAKAKVADAQHRARIDVAAAKATQHVAEEKLNARKTADVQADADAAKTAATAAQERINVENSQSVLDNDLLVTSFSGCFTAPVQIIPNQVREVPGPIRVVDNSCLYFKPITPSDADVGVMSRDLINQISTHDKVGIQHCNWKFSTAPAQSSTSSGRTSASSISNK